MKGTPVLPDEQKMRVEYLQARLGEEGHYSQMSRCISQAEIHGNEEEAQVMMIDGAQVLHLKWLEKL